MMACFLLLLFSGDFIGGMQGGAARGPEENREHSLLPKAAFCDYFDDFWGSLSEPSEWTASRSLSTY